jgi:phosphate acyltransferase
MGGDLGLRASIPASLKALKDYSDLHLTLVGDQSLIKAELSGADCDWNRLTVLHSDAVVDMDEKPSHALRHKRDSSMGVALQLLGNGQVDAVVSAGNTGALMALACLHLGRLPGLRRPAICAAIPAVDGFTLALDLGANVECSASELHQFATMGSALYKVLTGCDKPRVGLLNIGEEIIKGTQVVRDAAELLDRDQAINYIGFVEGGDYFSAAVDVVVSDGFAGNVALKASEGTANYISGRMQDFLQRHWGLRLLKGIMAPAIRRFRGEIDPRRFNGAAFLGLNGVVVKAHGSSEAVSYFSALQQAIRAAKSGLPKLIEESL